MTARRRGLIGLVAASLGLAAIAGLVTREWPAWRAARDVRAALAAGRYEAAWAAVTRWSAIRPDSAEAQFYRARAAIATGRSVDAGDGLTRARRLGYPDDRLAVLRALLDAQHGRPSRAQPVLAREFASARGPDPMLDEALARVYLDTYDFQRAGAVLERWAKDAPDDPRPPFWHAAVHRRRDAEPRIIIADYQEALRRDPNHADARLGLADELAEVHRNREAAVAYEAFLALRPDDPTGHLGAGRNASELDDKAAAVRHLDRALELDPRNATAHLERGKLDLRRGEPAGALPHLDRAAELSPFDPLPHYHRSLALKRLGRGDESAREHAAFTRLTRDRAGLEEVQARLADSPDDPRLQTEVARWMFAHGYDAEAVRWSRKILLDHPGYPEASRLLADHYDRQGQPDQAAAYRRSAPP